MAKELRNSGMDYMEYTIEITTPLYLKMTVETDNEKRLFPKTYTWKKLISLRGSDQLNYYKSLIKKLSQSKNQKIAKTFKFATTSISKPIILSKILDTINNIDWFSAKEEGLGDFYESLLEKTGSEGGKGAGQYFTPREIINLAVTLTKPIAGEIIQDPALGTGGFIRVADQYIKRNTDDLFKLTPPQQKFQKEKAYCGYELVPKVYFLCLMNMLLHNIDGFIENKNTLTAEGKKLPKADLILANPPFGVSSDDSLIDRDDFLFDTNNKQLSFLQHIYRSLKHEGRAAVIFPDNILFEEGMGKKIRRDFLEKCNLQCILRLPNGVFLNSKGNRTNLLFFKRGKEDKDSTKNVLIYDLRTNMESFGKRNRLQRYHFQHFISIYENIVNGKKIKLKESDENINRYKLFSIKEIKDNDFDLDIRWLKDQNKLSIADVMDTNKIFSDITSNIKNVSKHLNELEQDLNSFNITNSKSPKDLIDFLPDGWEKVQLKELMNNFDKKRIPLNDEERRNIKGDYPYYGANGKIDSINKYIFEGDYILIAEDGGYFDDARLDIAYNVSGKFWVNNHAHILQGKNIQENRFCLHLLNSIDWSLDARGSTRDKLSQEDLMTKIIKIPKEKSERLKIAKQVDLSLKKINSIKKNLNLLDIKYSKSKFSHFYPSILFNAFNGRIK